MNPVNTTLLKKFTVNFLHLCIQNNIVDRFLQACGFFENIEGGECCAQTSLKIPALKCSQPGQTKIDLRGLLMLRSTNVTCYIFIIVCGSLLIYGKKITDSCIRNTSGIIIESSFYTLPLFNERSANDAREFCRLAGSNISNFRSAEARRLLQPFFYTSILKKNTNLLKVNIYQNTENKNWLRFFLSAESIGVKPDIYLTSLKPYLDGYEVFQALPYITLYRRFVRNMTSMVGINFCTRRNLEGRQPDLVTKSSCPTQTIRSFESYDEFLGNSQIYIEHYRTSDQSSFLQLSGKPVTTGLVLNTNFPLIRIPADISVLTGIRSDYNQRKWYWDGESEVSELSLTDSNFSICQQMTWQLGILNDFIYSPVECSKANRRFSCEYPMKFYLDQVSCFSTALRLSWKFEGIRHFKSNIKLTAAVFLESGHSLRNETFQLNHSEFIIGQLREDSIYAVQIFSDICFENRIAALTNRTGRGAPGTVPNPRVLEHEYGTNSCIIAWNHDYFRDRGILVYRIIATNNIGRSQNILVSTSTNPSLEDRVNQQHSYKVNLNEDLLNTNVHFTIQGITCEFEGQLALVRGSCVVFDESQNRLNVSPRESVSIFIIISIIFTITFLISLACKAKREKRITEQKSKTWNERKQRGKAKSRRPYTENYYDQSVYSIDDKTIETNYYESQQESIYENASEKRKASLAVKLSEEDKSDEEN